MHLSLHHHRSYSTLAIEGSLTGTAIDGVIDMFSMVPVGQRLVVDLSAVTIIDDDSAGALCDELRDRADTATVIVVVHDVEVTMQLVLRNLDRCTRFARTKAEAIALATGVLAGQR